MSGDSLASMFYWTIIMYKRGDTEGKTLMGRFGLNVESASSGPTDWILRYIKMTFFTF